MSRTAGFKHSRIRWPASATSRPIDGILRDSLVDASWSFCRHLVETGKVTIDGEAVLDPRTSVRPNALIEINPRSARPNHLPAAQVRIVYCDVQIIVADKPSGVSTVPFDSSERGTFDELVRKAVGKLRNQRLPPLGIVHRIDKETSGLVVFARTASAKHHLKQQFRFHTNHRAYLALAYGHVVPGTITTRLVADRGDGRRGSTQNPAIGRTATTSVTVVERFSVATLIRCRLETGRTHQIRIHLAETGHPLLGERVYGRRGVEAMSVPRLMLHAAELGITHPTRELRLNFESELPDDFAQTLAALRGRD
jgi:23S rRNA pseudouridine1911/1915/1917 synthase